MKSENICTHDIQKFRVRIEQLRGDMSQKEFCKGIGVKPRTYQNWINPLYKGYNGKMSYTLPTIETAIRICDKYKVSLDYLFGRIDCETVTNQNIYDMIGLNDQGIDGLKYIKQSDHNASEYCGQPGLCVLPLLNKLLHHKSFEFVLRAIHDFMNTDYILPVYHTKKGVIHKPKAGKYKGQNVAYPETIQSQSDFDYMGTNKEIPLQHFARENDIYDNIAIPITKEFMQAVAIQRLGFELEQIKQDMENEK